MNKIVENENVTYHIYRKRVACIRRSRGNLRVIWRLSQWWPSYKRVLTSWKSSLFSHLNLILDYKISRILKIDVSMVFFISYPTIMFLELRKLIESNWVHVVCGFLVSSDYRWFVRSEKGFGRPRIAASPYEIRIIPFLQRGRWWLGLFSLALRYTQHLLFQKML